jgi:putative membrane protein
MWSNAPRRRELVTSSGDQSEERWWSTLVPGDPRAVGEEPDYRFTLANERTFLAWVRTSLALAAGGLGAIALLPDLAGSKALGLGLLALSFVTSASSYRRWARNEAAMRLGAPLAHSRLPAIMAIGAGLFVLAGGILLVLDGT